MKYSSTLRTISFGIPIICCFVASGCSSASMQAFSAAARATADSANQRYGNGRSGYYEGSSLQTVAQGMNTAANIADLILNTKEFEIEFNTKLTAQYGYQIAVDEIGSQVLADAVFSSLTGNNRKFGDILKDHYTSAFRQRLREELSNNSNLRRVDELSKEVSGILIEFRSRIDHEFR